MYLSYNLPSHLKRITTLPCENLKQNATDFKSIHCELLACFRVGHTVFYHHWHKGMKDACMRVCMYLLIYYTPFSLY